MAENPDRPAVQEPSAESVEHGMTRIEPGGDQHAPRARRSFTSGVASVRRRAVGIVATAVSAVTTVVVVILAVHIVFVAFEANTANSLVDWFGDRANELCWQFKDVFQPENPKVEVAVNYGLAALVYLIGGRIVVAVIRRLA